MVTIVTNVHLKDGCEQEWDAAMQERMAAARNQPGWIGGQMLEPDDDPVRRVIVGTWHSRDDWEKWHADPSFADTRDVLEGLTAGPEQHAWHDVVLDVRPAAQATAPRSASRRRAG